MGSITFEAFCERLIEDKDKDLRVMAQDMGLQLPSRLSRENLLKRLYEAYDGDKESTPADSEPVKESTERVSTEIPSVSVPPGPGEDVPRVVYHVFLRAKVGRRRGGRFWKLGNNIVPAEEMSKELLEALQNDKSFTAVRVG